MTAPTLATFRALLDEHGFACSWSPMTEVRAKALHAALFPPALPHAQHIELGSLETSEAEARSPGALWLPLATPAVEDVLRRAAPRECACFDGMCRCEVINGRTSTGARCRAHLADTLTADGSVR
jgi:hypothetical protein